LGQNFKNGSRDPDHAHKGIVCHPKAFGYIAFCIFYLHTKFDDCSCSRSRDMVRAYRNLNGSRDLDHAPFRHVLSSVG